MNTSTIRMCASFSRRVAQLCVLTLSCASAVAWATDKASGSITLGKHSANIQHATLVRGPDEMSGKTLLRLYLSAADLSAAVKACKTLSCADAAFTDGAAVDFSDASHLGYWVALNGGLAQYSGGTDKGAFTLSANTADHLVGKLHIDDAAASGAKIDAEFDATVSNTFAKVR